MNGRQGSVDKASNNNKVGVGEPGVVKNLDDIGRLESPSGQPTLPLHIHQTQAYRRIRFR